MVESICLSAPIKVCIDITNKCNCSCLHCHACANERNFDQELKTNEIFELIDQCANANVFLVQIGGGEPTIHPDFLHILKYAIEKVPSVTLSTNGYQASDQFAEKLANIGLKTIQVSLDGAVSDVHDKFRGLNGSWIAATNAIKFYSLHNIKTAVACTLHPGNIDTIREMVDLVETLGAYNFRIMNLMPAGRALLNIDQMIPHHIAFKAAHNLIKIKKEKERSVRLATDIAFFTSANIDEIDESKFDEIDRYFVGCEAGKQQIRISPNGDVWPCPLVNDIEFLAGNIRKQSLMDIWRNSEALHIFRKISTENRAGCKKCKYGFLCNGGCPAVSLNVNGSFNAPDSRCPYNPLNDHTSVEIYPKC